MAMAVSGEQDGRYQSEYRLMMADGSTRWMSSQGRVECDAAGHPVLIRGAARDVTARKNAEAVVRNLSGRLLSAQEEERRRIARELHDNLSQQLALLSIEIETVAMTPGGPGRACRSRCDSSARGRRRLRPRCTTCRTGSTRRKLETLGLQAAVQGHCRELRAQGLQVQSLIENVPGGLGYDVALCLFRVVQEGLNNVVKHSGADEARVTLTGAERRAGVDASPTPAVGSLKRRRPTGRPGWARQHARARLPGGRHLHPELGARPGRHHLSSACRSSVADDDRPRDPPAAGRRLRRGCRRRAAALRRVADGDSPNTAL